MTLGKCLSLAFKVSGASRNRDDVSSVCCWRNGEKCLGDDTLSHSWRQKSIKLNKKEEGEEWKWSRYCRVAAPKNSFRIVPHHHHSSRAVVIPSLHSPVFPFPSPHSRSLTRQRRRPEESKRFFIQSVEKLRDRRTSPPISSTQHSLPRFSNREKKREKRKENHRAGPGSSVKFMLLLC